MTKLDFTITVLGKPTLQLSKLSKKKDVWQTSYVNDDQYILYDIAVTRGTSIRSTVQNNLIEKAGPREKFTLILLRCMPV